jgi:hypothetical protein
MEYCVEQEQTKFNLLKAPYQAPRISNEAICSDNEGKKTSRANDINFHSHGRDSTKYKFNTNLASTYNIK